MRMVSVSRVRDERGRAPRVRGCFGSVRKRVGAAARTRATPDGHGGACTISQRRELHAWRFPGTSVPVFHGRASRHRSCRIEAAASTIRSFHGVDLRGGLGHLVVQGPGCFFTVALVFDNDGALFFQFELRQRCLFSLPKGSAGLLDRVTADQFLYGFLISNEFYDQTRGIADCL